MNFVPRNFKERKSAASKNDFSSKLPCSCPSHIAALTSQCTPLDSAFALRQTCDGGEGSGRARSADRVRRPFRSWPATLSDKHASGELALSRDRHTWLHIQDGTWVSCQTPLGRKKTARYHTKTAAVTDTRPRATVSGLGLRSVGLGRFRAGFDQPTARPSLTGHAGRSRGAGRPAARRVPCKDTTGIWRGGSTAGAAIFSTFEAGTHRPLSVVGLRRKRGPVTLTRTAWVQFLLSPTHETCLCCCHERFNEASLPEASTHCQSLLKNSI